MGSLGCLEKTNNVGLRDVGGFEEEGFSDSTEDRGTVGSFLIRLFLVKVDCDGKLKINPQL